MLLEVLDAQGWRIVYLRDVKELRGKGPQEGMRGRGFARAVTGRGSIWGGHGTGVMRPGVGLY